MNLNLLKHQLFSFNEDDLDRGFDWLKVIAIVGVILAILMVIIHVTLLKTVKDDHIAPPEIKEKMQYHGTQAAWEVDGKFYFTRNPADWEKRDKWIRL